MIKTDKLLSNVREQIDILAKSDTTYNVIGYSNEKGLMYESMKHELTNTITNNIINILNDSEKTTMDKMTKIISPLVFLTICNFVMEYNLRAIEK